MPVTQSSHQQFVQTLASLTGSEFEDAVCKHLSIAIADFHPVPDKGGDGGLDGISHEGTQGYCCYGPQFKPQQATNNRVTEVVEKFKKDLCRIFEIDGMSTLAHCTNAEIKEALPDGARLTRITLIASWASDKRIYQRLKSAFDKLKAKSQCCYVSPEVVLTVRDPEFLAASYPVTEASIAMLERAHLHRLVQELAQTVDLGLTVDFDQKIAVLKELFPTQLQTIETFATSARAAWKMSLALEQRLAETSPVRHQAIEDARVRIAAHTSTEMLGASAPWELLPDLKEYASDAVAHALGEERHGIAADAGFGEIARLIGECTIGWEKST